MKTKHKILGTVITFIYMISLLGLYASDSEFGIFCYFIANILSVLSLIKFSNKYNT